MTPKEKAKKLVDRFINQMPKYLQGKTGRLTAKQCALICVDEMLAFAYDVEWEKKEDALSKMKFLKEVKQELLKL
jgi:hypothetical protein